MTTLRSHRWALSLLLLLAAPLPLLAAGPKPAEVEEAVKAKLKSADDLLSVLDVQKSREILEEVARDPKTKGASKKLRARVYATLGRVRAELGDELGMDDAFSEAVKLDRGVKLPRSASPKILDALERIRAGAPKDEPPPHRPEPSRRPEHERAAKLDGGAAAAKLDGGAAAAKLDGGAAAKLDGGAAAAKLDGGPSEARDGGLAPSGRDAAVAMGLAATPPGDGGAVAAKDAGALPSAAVVPDAGRAKDASATPDASATKDAGALPAASAARDGGATNDATPDASAAKDAGATSVARDAGPFDGAWPSDGGRLGSDAGRSEGDGGRASTDACAAPDAGARPAEPPVKPRPGLRAEIIGPKTSLSRVRILAVPTLLPESATYFARIRRPDERRFMPFLMTRTGTVAVLELRLTEARYELFLEAKDKGKVIAKAASADAPLVIETEQAPPIARAWAEPDLSPHPSPVRTSSSSTTALALGGEGFNSTTTWLVAGGVVAAAVLITIVVLVASGGSSACNAKEGFGCTEIRVLPLIGGD